MLGEVAFVGGCTTGLLLTDAFSREQVRHTDDVDLIVHVVGHVGWATLQASLRERGFRDDVSDDGPICAMKLGELRVDFMPDDASVLSFTNRWYGDALRTATAFPLDEDLEIRLVLPQYFVATKLEAYQHRGNDDPLGSQDMEDLLILVDGRPELLEEMKTADPDLRDYCANRIRSLFDNRDFDYAVQAASCGDNAREELIWERLETLARGAS